jgi:hypothetical protein
MESVSAGETSVTRRRLRLPRLVRHYRAERCEPRKPFLPLLASKQKPPLTL